MRLQNLCGFIVTSFLFLPPGKFIFALQLPTIFLDGCEREIIIRFRRSCILFSRHFIFENEYFAIFPLMLLNL